jgi:hypothetical protein
MATKKSAKKPATKTSKPAAKKTASKPAAKNTPPKAKKKKGEDDEDMEMIGGIEDDDFKMDDNMELNMFSDGYDDDDDF